MAKPVCRTTRSDSFRNETAGSDHGLAEVAFPVARGQMEYEAVGETAMCATSEFRATDALPGSAEKVEILAGRIRLGLPLWHPDDLHTEDVLFAAKSKTRSHN